MDLEAEISIPIALCRRILLRERQLWPMIAFTGKHWSKAVENMEEEREIVSSEIIGQYMRKIPDYLPLQYGDTGSSRIFALSVYVDLIPFPWMFCATWFTGLAKTKEREHSHLAALLAQSHTIKKCDGLIHEKRFPAGEKLCCFVFCSHTRCPKEGIQNSYSPQWGW